MPAFCYTPQVVVHTVGHSTSPLDAFLELLRRHGIAALADVRRHPGSRRHPHFAREALAAALAAACIGYVWIPALGGRRRGRADSPHLAWRNAAFRAYADHMETPEFARGLAELLELARAAPTAVVCAEAVPWRCHRQLIADALVACGVEVRHLLGARPPEVHRLTPFARREGTRLVYDGGQAALAPPAPSRCGRDRP
jgi:uncharacterized protein (DUF488 family)